MRFRRAGWAPRAQQGRKLKRIRAAAKRLFSEQGFEATTTRQIAEAADIGTGTLFLYAKTKEELLVLVFRAVPLLNGANR